MPKLVEYDNIAQKKMSIDGIFIMLISVSQTRLYYLIYLFM